MNKYLKIFLIVLFNLSTINRVFDVTSYDTSALSWFLMGLFFPDFLRMFKNKETVTVKGKYIQSQKFERNDRKL